MEQKKKQNEQVVVNKQQVVQAKEEPVKKARRKMIPRNKKIKSLKKKSKKGDKNKKIKKQKKQQIKLSNNQQVQILAVLQVKQIEIKQNQFQVQEQIENLKKPTIIKIQFDPKELPVNLQQNYNKKQKMKNTELVVDGCKFCSKISKKVLQKWDNALVIYQQNYKKNTRIHFGVILKYGKRLITFDGVPKLWPISEVQKSYHWMEQIDTWSCGYRVYFWVKKILEQGIDKWIKQFQMPLISEKVEVKTGSE